MREHIAQSKSNKVDAFFSFIKKSGPALSLVVVLGVFWILKLTGITLAEDAFCGIEQHIHDETCGEKTLVCTLEEEAAHIHSESCLLKACICTDESEEHEHTDACYTVVAGFSCGLLEKDGHTHNAECIHKETQFACGEKIHAGHTHTDACFVLSGACAVAEHIHTESCYSDITKDIETEEDWIQTFAELQRSGVTGENIAAVAKSQIGYTESTLNFQIDAAGVRRGITRYGQWYGNPYGDWSAMFASFCLYYAGADDLPANAGAESMRLEWEQEGLYQSITDGTAKIGNLLFIDRDENGAADSVAIITEADENKITVVEGDFENAVTEYMFGIADPAMLGYGVVPTKDKVIMLAAPNAVAAEACTVWLDGTDGGIGYLTGSPNTAYATETGALLKLPETWTSPSKYSYTLRGWYDVKTGEYYLPGEEMLVTGNTVLYADWIASTYDIGRFNANVANTVSTNAFITTHLFDYNYLFNILSSNATVTVSSTSHSETWKMLGSGTVDYKDAQTLNFIFADADSSGRLSTPSNRTTQNSYHSATTVTANIYTAALGNVLFSPDNAFNPATGEGILGKTYLGTGDHLFQLETDPNSEFYGYHYYDSKKNAASYNQSNKRFYVYDYLSATSDSIGGAYSDFLPLNSPYANTNGKTVGTYTYAGEDNEYSGVTHYRYDSKYSSGTHNSTDGVYTDYAYGMRSDIHFYLPNDPGTDGNKDLNGNDIEFRFSGDDDLWVLIDGKMVLDIGGIHQSVAGVINFATGTVTVNNQNKTSLQDLGIGEGDHTLTVLYLERGASMSNCAIYFNIVPRYGLEIKKEDVLTQELLDGAEFSVYRDFECTEPAELWASEAEQKADLADGVLDAYTNTFTIKNGVTSIWGLGSGNTYYIKETGPPDAEEYAIPNGVIRLSVEKGGLATYHAEAITDADGNEPSNGFTVHGIRIDEETQTIYLVVTNAPETVTETTTVQVVKKWEDTADHSNDYITAYLTVIEADGTVRRIREIVLSDENGWTYTWTNLPKFDYVEMKEVHYGIEESYESGYYSTVREITEIDLTQTTWGEAGSFETGDEYILQNSSGQCLSTTSNSDTKLKWVDSETAKTSPLALWKATLSGSNVKFTNGAGHTLTINENGTRYVTASTANSSSYQYFTPVKEGSSFRFYLRTNNNRTYFIYNLDTSRGRFSTITTERYGIVLTPFKLVTESDIRPVEDWGYQITNTPLPSRNETSMTVTKSWVVPPGTIAEIYEESLVTVRLLANGVNTGRTVTLSLKNNWQAQFLGLPYTDENGDVIVYTVEENWNEKGWKTNYGEIVATDSSPPDYSTTITNQYSPGGPLLPSTGSASRLMYVLCGAGIMLGTLVYGIGSRRKRERRMK